MTGSGTVARREVVVTRTFESNDDTLFSLWTEPAYFAYWFGGDVEVRDVEMDVRDGGQWCATMHPADAAPMRFAGTYLDIVVPERIVMRFEQAPGASGNRSDWQILTATFTETDGGGTRLELRHEGLMPESNVAALHAGYATFLERMWSLADDGKIGTIYPAEFRGERTPIEDD
jgi:uncharacterized protein YndB with AHSA1/START domain